MALTVESVNPEAARDELLAVLQRNLTDLDHARRFRWLYLDNPAGPARAWFLRERDGGGPMGAASLFPRWVWLGGRVHLCGQVGDFAVDAAYRSLGPAVMLQRATFGPVDGRALAFCYDCPPHDKGMATFRRLGLGAQCHMLRHARLLKVDRLVRRRVRPAAAAAALSWLGNGALRLAGARRHAAVGLAIDELTGRFDDEFSALDAEVGAGEAIRGRRRAEELNWRYRDDPLHRYIVLTARRAGALVAFAVVLSGGADAYLLDLFGRLTPEVAAQLVDGAVDRLRRTDAQTLHALASDGGDLAGVLGAAGFRYRSSGPAVVAYAPGGADVKPALDARRWSFAHGDIRA